MAEGKNKVVIYTDWSEDFQDLTDEEAGKLIKHFFKYVNDENPVLEDRVLQAVWKPMQRTLKRDLAKWLEVREKRSKAGKASADKRQQESTHVDTSQQESTHVNTKEQSSTNSTVKDKVKVKVKDSKVKDSIYSFQSFWDDYSKKTDKVKCEKKYSNISEKDRALIKAAVPLYVRSTQDVQYRKNPLTWLNGKCWNDETEQPKREPRQHAVL